MNHNPICKQLGLVFPRALPMKNKDVSFQGAHDTLKGYQHHR